MANLETSRKEFIAYKLMEWAGCCKDRNSFNKLTEAQKRNALAEAEHILKVILS